MQKKHLAYSKDKHYEVDLRVGYGDQSHKNILYYTVAGDGQVNCFFFASVNLKPPPLFEVG